MVLSVFDKLKLSEACSTGRKDLPRSGVLDPRMKDSALVRRTHFCLQPEVDPHEQIHEIRHNIAKMVYAVAPFRSLGSSFPPTRSSSAAQNRLSW
jgi:hypothetical protein